MRIALNGVAKRPALDTMTLTYGTGEAVLARAETEQRPSVLGLLASGRMQPDSGSVTLDGEADAAGIRRRVALVDAPAVCDPAPNVTVAGVAAEELMFAGRPSGPRAVKRALGALGLASFAGDAIGQVPPTVRIRLLVELALLRDGVQGIVLTSPDRHGGDPNAWWRVVLEVASRGIAVLVIAGDASAAAIAANSLVERLETPWPDAVPDDDPTRDDSDLARPDLPDVITRPVPIIGAASSAVDAAGAVSAAIAPPAIESSSTVGDPAPIDQPDHADDRPTDQESRAE